VLYVDNGNVLTSAGAAAGFDLCLHLVRRDLGAEIAASAARAVVMPLERSGGQAQFIVYEQPAVVESMGPLFLWLVQNIDKQLSLSAIARHAAIESSFRAGVDVIAVDDVSVRIYSPEKTIADCFKYRNKIGLDVAVEALRA
jgi:hypothetical protein